MRGIPIILSMLLCLSCSSPSPSWTPAFDATSTGWLYNVWGPSGDDLYAAGGTPTAGVVLHWDGHAWTALDVGVAVPLLDWSYGFGANDVFVVGARGTVLHFDGHAWAVQSTPTTQQLWGVWGAAPNDVYAVGGSGDVSGHGTVLHYDGIAWTELALPALVRPNVFAYYKVWGADASHVFVVGQRGVVMRWDGATWHEDDLDVMDDAISVWGTSADHVFVIGGRANGYVARWDGASWTTHAFLDIALPGLNGIWMRDPAVAHAVGVDGAVVRIDTATLTVTADDSLDTRQVLHSVFGDSSGMLTAVGGNLNAAGAPYTGIAMHRRLATGE